MKHVKLKKVKRIQRRAHRVLMDLYLPGHKLMTQALNRGDAKIEPCPNCDGTLIHSLTIRGLRYTQWLHNCRDCGTWFDDDTVREWVYGPSVFGQIGIEVSEEEISVCEVK